MATAAYKDFSGQVKVPPSDYRIRITPSGTTSVLFDSGTAALGVDADLLIVAAQNTGTSSAPVTLLVCDGSSYLNIWEAKYPRH